MKNLLVAAAVGLCFASPAAAHDTGCQHDADIRYAIWRFNVALGALEEKPDDLSAAHAVAEAYTDFSIANGPYPNGCLPSEYVGLMLRSARAAHVQLRAAGEDIPALGRAEAYLEWLKRTDPAGWLEKWSANDEGG